MKTSPPKERQQKDVRVVGWSLILRVLQNAILSTVLPALLPNFYAIVFLALYAIGLVACAVMLIRRRHEITAWCKVNHWANGKTLWVMTTVSMLLFVAPMTAFIAVYTIVPVKLYYFYKINTNIDNSYYIMV